MNEEYWSEEESGRIGFRSITHDSNTPPRYDKEALTGSPSKERRKLAVFYKGRQPGTARISRNQFS